MIHTAESEQNKPASESEQFSVGIIFLSESCCKTNKLILGFLQESFRESRKEKQNK